MVTNTNIAIISIIYMIIYYVLYKFISRFILLFYPLFIIIADYLNEQAPFY
jgi:hypothetical protein